MVPPSKGLTLRSETCAAGTFRHVSARADVQMGKGVGMLISRQLPQAQTGVRTAECMQQSLTVAGRKLLPCMMQVLSHDCLGVPACQCLCRWCSNSPEGWTEWQLA